jgi:hypothetical protein
MAAGGERTASRTTASVGLAAVGAVLVVLGTLLFYARSEIIDEEAFADHAVEALDDDELRAVVATEITVQLVERSSADLVAARPLIEQVVATVVDTRPFKQVFREAARQANRLLFIRSRDNVAFNVSDAVEIIRFGVKSIDPELAADLPKRDLDLALLTLREREFARQSLVVADEIRLFGLIVPIAALLALIGAAVAAPDRRVGVLRAALALAAGGLLLAVVYLILRARVLSGVIGDDELTDEEVRDAVAAILDAFLGGLFAWALALAGIGALVAGAAAALDPERAEDPVLRLRRRLTERPQGTVGRAARGLAAVAAGLLFVFDWQFAFAVLGLLIGAYLVYFGAGELLLLLQAPDEGTERAAARKRSLVRTAAVALAGIAAIVVAVLIVTSGPGPREGARASTDGGCNGSPALCDLQLNQVVFAGTHNSFSAADSRGWFIANQRHDIARQLEDGVRLLLIDPHWGVADARGRVRTDFAAEGRDRNRVAKALPPAVLAAAERLAGSLGVRAEGGGEREIFLCHTVCELGATRMSDALVDVRDFLDANPGEVVILFIEPYVPPAEIAKSFEEAGLAERTTVLDRSEPLPTLGELVRRDDRLIVFTERDADGSVPWYLDGFDFVQDTPLGATEVEQLSCELNRGTASSPLLMLNHWADVFPPRRGANVDFQTRRELLGRAHECARKRGLPVNLIAVDHYDVGELIPGVERLNRERIAAARRAARR